MNNNVEKPIMLQEIQHACYPDYPEHRYAVEEESEDDDDDDDDDDVVVQFSRHAYRERDPKCPESPASSDQNLATPTDQHYNVSASLASNHIAVPTTPVDVAFACTLCLTCVANLCVDFSLVGVYHYNREYWAAGLTACWIGVGGVVVLKRFWDHVTESSLDLIYDRGKCVRIAVNCFPWAASVITTYECAKACHGSISNPMMVTQRYVKLEQFSRSLLRIQSFGQCAPQAVLQLVLVLEKFQGLGGYTLTLSITCILLSLTLMMSANLPGKGDEVVDGVVPRAAYSPASKLFVGLRMMSSFCSRTMCLSLFFASFRCVVGGWRAASHSIPVAILVLPRLVFAVTEFSGILVSYVATVLFPFGEPGWLFWYVSIETVVFVGVGGAVYGVWACGVSHHWHVVAVYSCLFVVFWAGIPCVLPYAAARWTRPRNRGTAPT